MATRITRKDLEGMFGRVVRGAAAAGITESADWTLEIGSSTYGRAFRLYLRGEHGSLCRTVLDDSYLGMNTGDAYDALYAMARAFEAVQFTKSV